VWLVVVGPLILPVLRLARILTDAPPSDVVGDSCVVMHRRV